MQQAWLSICAISHCSVGGRCSRLWCLHLPYLMFCWWEVQQARLPLSALSHYSVGRMYSRQGCLYLPYLTVLLARCVAGLAVSICPISLFCWHEVQQSSCLYLPYLTVLLVEGAVGMTVSICLISLFCWQDVQQARLSLSALSHVLLAGCAADFAVSICPISCSVGGMCSRLRCLYLPYLMFCWWEVQQALLSLPPLCHCSCSDVYAHYPTTDCVAALMAVMCMSNVSPLTVWQP